ncbi:PREDICTED: barH-like 2 homeobox protein, partial [Lepidothrix coronata]|uniref:BarH-like 2 homeobox protein n=1 Tax=Lepidothrix coronata TaxID=321398 RepID=A0A6J0JA34_9PASS
MEGPSGSSFGIDTILSSGSTGSPGVMNGDFRPHGDGRPADFRSQATPSPCSEIDTVGTAPSSPISDILGDSKPLAACAPYSTSVPSPHHTPKQEGSAAPESFRPKLEQEDGKAKLDKRDDTQGDIKCHGKYGPALLRTASAAGKTGAAAFGLIGETKIVGKIC